MGLFTVERFVYFTYAFTVFLSSLNNPYFTRRKHLISVNDVKVTVEYDMPTHTIYRWRRLTVLVNAKSPPQTRVKKR